MKYGKWKWIVRGYYTQDVEPPKTPGGFAIEIGGVSREALQMDLDVLYKRPDIGEIEGPFQVRD